MGKKRKGFGGFLFGALVGVGIGVLFAPKSGKETRKELKEKFDELVKKVKEMVYISSAIASDAPSCS